MRIGELKRACPTAHRQGRYRQGRRRLSGRLALRRTALIVSSMLAVLLIGLVGCTSMQQEDGKQEPPQIAVRPEAEPSHDDSYKGIYKGVLTTADSSGMFKLNIKNSSPEEIRLRGMYKGEPFSLQGEERYDPEEEEYTYTFEGTSSDEKVTIAFTTSLSVSGEIDKRNTTFEADGQPVNVNIMKESSDVIVRVYEGTYSGDSSGTWNYILKNERISGYYAGDGEGRFSGKFDADTEKLRVWGSKGNMLARGVIRDSGATSGAWKYRTGSNYSESTSLDTYPAVESSSNRWQGRRTL